MHPYVSNCLWVINSLAPGGFDYSLKLVNFKFISTINIWSIFCEIAIRWMPQYLTDHWSTLVQVMAWCRQATSHYLSQCWPRSLSPYDVTRPQWVKYTMNTLIQYRDHSGDGCFAKTPTIFIICTFPKYQNEEPLGIEEIKFIFCQWESCVLMMLY